MVVDGIVLIVVIAAAIRAAIRGFVAELFGVAAIATGIGVGALLYGLLAVAMDGWWGVSVLNRIGAFLAIFLACYLLLKLVEALFHRFFDALELEKLDRVLGLFVGLAEGLALTFALFVVLRLVDPIVGTSSLFDGSIVAEYIFQPLLHDAVTAAGEETVSLPLGDTLPVPPLRV